MPLDASYISMKSQVIKAERRLLKELGFCVHVKHPHKASPGHTHTHTHTHTLMHTYADVVLSGYIVKYSNLC